MAELPAQLTCREFLSVRVALGYEQMPSGRGSARSFRKKGSDPAEIVTFHQPHGKDTIRSGTLRAYIRNLGLAKEEFVRLLQ